MSWLKNLTQRQCFAKEVASKRRMSFPKKEKEGSRDTVERRPAQVKLEKAAHLTDIASNANAKVGNHHDAGGS